MSEQLLVDQLSLELADHFLRGTPYTEDDRRNLAIAIQQAVEDWLDAREQRDVVERLEGCSDDD